MKTLYEEMFLILTGIVFQVVMYFSVKWAVVCFGVRVFEFRRMCWCVFGMNMWLSSEYRVGYSWMWDTG